MLSQGHILNTYEILSVIGQGGFGIVYKGKHRELGIDVAIKEYFPSDLSVRRDGTVQPITQEFQDPFEEGLERFLREAKQLERFRDCPNIVTCRDLFRANGTAYTIMDYVPGLSLSKLLEYRESRGEPLTEGELLDLILPLLSGLQKIHDADICHRDIKPSNILVRRDDSAPILIDFGAAKHEISKHTKSIAPYTDGYAAMEQVGEGEIGPWTDMYGLGAVMWRIVAGGNPPFSPPNPPTVQKRAFEMMQGQPDPLPPAKEVGKGRFASKLLQAIDDCLTVNVNDRIQNCTRLIERLQPHTTGMENIAASLMESERNEKPVNELSESQTDTKDHPNQAKEKIHSIALLIFIISAILITAFVTYGVFFLSEEKSHDINLSRGISSIDSAGQEISTSPVVDDTILTVPHITTGQNQSTAPPSMRTNSNRRMLTLRGHTEPVTSVVFSPDGTQIASGSLDGSVRVWSASTGKQIRRVNFGDVLSASIKSVVFSPNGAHLAVAWNASSISLYGLSLFDASRGSWVPDFSDPRGESFFQSVAFSPDGSLLVSGSWDSDANIVLWDAATGEMIRQFSQSGYHVNSVVFSPDGTLIASGGGLTSGIINVRNLSTDVVRRFRGHTYGVESIAFSPDGTILASSSPFNDETIRLWDMSTGQELRSISGSYYCLAFSPDGTILASGSSDTVLWDVSTGEEIRRFDGSAYTVNSVAFSPDGAKLIAAQRRVVYIYEI